MSQHPVSIIKHVNKNFISRMAFVLAAFQSPTAFAAFSGSSMSATASDPTLISNISQSYKSFDGKIVSQIKFFGLMRTKEKSARWLMSTSEGEVFDSEKLATDIQRLYNTGNLYEIDPVVTEDPSSPGSVIIKIKLTDKWTLLPFGGLQGGGGSYIIGGGLEDTNLGGYFISAYAAGYNYNGTFSYEVNFSDEYIVGSSYMGSLDLQSTVAPTSIHRQDNSFGGKYTWQRNQLELMAGDHLRDSARIFIFGDLYQDSILSTDTPNASVYQGIQYRIHPQLILGRANIQDYLESGHELTLHPTFANFFDPSKNFESLVLSFKYVGVLPHQANFAYFVSGTVTSMAPPIYQTQVGGYSSVRGFADSRQVGPYSLSTNIEYRPILWTHRFALLDLVALQGVFFNDVGSAWGDSTLTGDNQLLQPHFLWAAGLGLRFNFLHFAGAILRLDLARTINPDEGVGISFGVGQFF